jgi:hypothetical protein
MSSKPQVSAAAQQHNNKNKTPYMQRAVTGAAIYKELFLYPVECTITRNTKE